MSADQNELIAAFTVAGEPVSKARARFTGKGSKVRAYTPAKVLTAEQAVAFAFTSAGGRYDPSTETTYMVEATFYNGTRQRRDVDNMMKLILDGLNKVAWVDDTQVMDIVGRKRFTTKAEARTEVRVYRAGTFNRLTAACLHCRKDYVAYESTKDKVRYCSAACRRAAQVAARSRTCEQCGTPFLAHGASASQRFCSKECRSQNGRITIPCKICGTEFRQYRSWAATRPYCSQECVVEQNRRVARERRTRTFPGSCAICGAGTTRKEYRRCNPCKLAGKQIPA